MIPNTYPFNLIRAVFGDKATDDTHIETVYLRGFYEQINTLTEQQQQALELRFQNGCTYQQGADACGVSRERFRQTIAKSLRRLKVRAIHYNGIPQFEVDRVKSKNVKLTDENAYMKQAMEQFNASGINPMLIAKIADFIKPEKLLTPLYELGLSTRTLNGTQRLFVNNVRDALETPESDFIGMAGFGEVSLNELQNAIRTHLLDMPTEQKQPTS